MACSNNVVRAALTPKFRDVNLLVEMLTYNMGAPAVLPAETVDACRKRYTPPINDFEIQILQVCAVMIESINPSIRVPALFASAAVVITRTSQVSPSPLCPVVDQKCCGL